MQDMIRDLISLIPRLEGARYILFQSLSNEFALQADMWNQSFCPNAQHPLFGHKANLQVFDVPKNRTSITLQLSYSRFVHHRIPTPEWTNNIHVRTANYVVFSASYVLQRRPEVQAYDAPTGFFFVSLFSLCRLVRSISFSFPELWSIVDPTRPYSERTFVIWSWAKQVHGYKTTLAVQELRVETR
jgi:hypothetical protein